KNMSSSYLDLVDKSTELENSKVRVYAKTAVNSCVVTQMVTCALRSHQCKDILFVKETVLELLELTPEGVLVSLFEQPIFGTVKNVKVLKYETDITIKGLEAIKSCERIYLEAYTSVLMVSKEKLEEFYDKKLILADREMVESQSDKILSKADKINVAFLVVGDPFGATTHTDLILRARELKIPVKIIHNASIMNAIGACGLQLYNFGQTVSIPFFTESWHPDSFYERIKENRSLGLHTLC
ncbi:13141_t:CDS:2, partial [Entrophospora sp. SA101]